MEFQYDADGNLLTTEFVELRMFLCSIGFLIYLWISARKSKNHFKLILKLLAKIDEIFNRRLNFQSNLKPVNDKVQKTLTFAFTITVFCYFYHPIMIFSHDTNEFLWYTFRLLPFVFIQMRITQILYLFYLIAEKLKVSSKILIETTNNEMKVLDSIQSLSSTFIQCDSIDKVKNENLTEKLIYLKEIYQKCWEIRKLTESDTKFDLLVYVFFCGTQLFPFYFEIYAVWKESYSTSGTIGGIFI